MQYNLAHSNYNSAKFNWIVYRRRSLAARYRNKRPPNHLGLTLHSSSFFSSASSFLPSFLRPCAGCYRKTKENSIDFPRACGRLLLLNSRPAQERSTRAPFTFHRGPPLAATHPQAILSFRNKTIGIECTLVPFEGGFSLGFRPLGPALTARDTLLSGSRCAA